jgi:hypothetical protein
MSTSSLALPAIATYDFAFGTCDELIPRVERVTDAAQIHKGGVNKPFARIQFDFSMIKEVAEHPPLLSLASTRKPPERVLGPGGCNTRLGSSLLHCMSLLM